MVIQKTGPNHDDFVFHLFCRPKNPTSEQWFGPWSGLQAAQDVFNADVAGDINNVEALLTPLLRGAGRIYTDIGSRANGGSKSLGNRTDLAVLIRTHTRAIGTSPLQPLVNELRAIKSPAEVANMRKAGQGSGRALTNAMRRAWSREKDLAAFLAYEYTRQGLDGPAYVPVVAGGTRGCLIHYTQNSRSLEAGDMVLADAGGEYGTYIADITRAWPVNGRFSPAQRDLYEAVLRVQRISVALCRESAGMSLDMIHRATEDGLRDQLAQLGFDLESTSLQTLFPHHVGHYVGLDVHDVPGHDRGRLLKAGHCVTIEPGVYVPNDARFPEHFRGLGVRIEDSVCVDDDSPMVLTTEAVKEVVDIEALRS